MNITVNARHMEVTDAIRGYVQTKVSKLPRFYDSVQSIEVILDREADQAVAEIVAHARRKRTFVATHRDPDMYASIDQCLDKIVNQLRRHKDKVRDHQAPPHAETMEPAGR